MKSFTAHIKRASLAVVMLSSALAYQNAFATAGETSANTDILNKATVSYSVSSIAQTAIESSPTGNSNPGVGNGTNTSFKVDRKVNFTVTASPTNFVAHPGQSNVVAKFTISNTGNDSEGFALAASNDTGTTVLTNVDNQQMNNLRVFVDANGNGNYDAGTDTATAVDTLVRDNATPLTVFIVADTPVAATNGQFANVTLTVTAAVAGTSGATLETQTNTANTAGVDVVFVGGADGSNHSVKTAADQYAIQSAALTVTKTSAVISDPINLAVNPKAIPLATVEYTITVTNSSTTDDATGVQISDPIPTNTLYTAGSLTLDGVSIPDSGNTTGTPVTAINTVSDAFTVAKNAGSKVLKFRVTIK